MSKTLKEKKVYSGVKNRKTTVKRSIPTSEQLVLHRTRYTKLKTLGAGIYGTTYEVIETDGKQGVEHMAFKVQKITPEYQKPDTEYPLWREIEFQNKFINNLPSADQDFFNRLHDYQIITNCQHTQKRRKVRVISNPRNKWEAKIFAIDKSPVCAYFLMDIVRGMTVNEYLQQILGKPNAFPSRKLIINLAQQFMKCLELLRQGGYGHFDEHFNNIMIESLTDATRSPGFTYEFKLGGITVNKLKYQLKLIDYGMVNHPKYKQRAKQPRAYEFFLSRPEDYYYIVAVQIMSSFFTNSAVCKSIYEIRDKKEPGEENDRPDQFLYLIKQITVSHPKFMTAAVAKYSAQYPEIREYIHELFTRIRNDVAPSLVKDAAKPLKPENYFYLSELFTQINFKAPLEQYLTEFVFYKITEEFRVRFTREHLEYSGYEFLDPRMIKFMAPKKDYLQVLGFKNLAEVIGWIAHLGSVHNEL